MFLLVLVSKTEDQSTGLAPREKTLEEALAIDQSID